MSLKKKLLTAAAVLVLVGVALIAFGDFRGPAPALECAEKGMPTSGFSTDTCKDGTTIESQKAYFDWNSTPRYGRIAGLGITVAGIGTAIAAAFVRSTKKTTEV